MFVWASTHVYIYYFRGGGMVGDRGLIPLNMTPLPFKNEQVQLIL